LIKFALNPSISDNLFFEIPLKEILAFQQYEEMTASVLLIYFAF